MKDPETGHQLAPRACPACDNGGDTRCKIQRDDADELTALRAIISRDRQRFKTLSVWVVGHESHRLIAEGLNDNKDLGYEIH